MVRSLNVRRGSCEEIWPLQRFFIVSMVLADLTLKLPLPLVSRMSKVYRELEVRIMEIKVAEINAPLNSAVRSYY